jgi:hypothetical protein
MVRTGDILKGVSCAGNTKHVNYKGLYTQLLARTDNDGLGFPCAVYTRLLTTARLER